MSVMHACLHVIAFAVPTGINSGTEKPPGEQPVIDTSQTVYLGQEVLTKQSSLEANGNVRSGYYSLYIICPPSM